MGVLIFVVAWINIDYTFIGYVLWRIHKKMRENVDRNVSAKAASVQRQVTRIMLLQAAIPLILCIPTSINILCALFKIDVPGFAPIVFSIIR
jgi:hypothetical protein